MVSVDRGAQVDERVRMMTEDRVVWFKSLGEKRETAMPLVRSESENGQMGRNFAACDSSCVVQLITALTCLTACHRPTHGW